MAGFLDFRGGRGVGAEEAAAEEGEEELLEREEVAGGGGGRELGVDGVPHAVEGCHYG